MISDYYQTNIRCLIFGAVVNQNDFKFIVMLLLQIINALFQHNRKSVLFIVGRNYHR